MTAEPDPPDPGEPVNVTVSIAEPTVTICKPGRRSKTIADRERTIIGGPPVLTATALQWPVAASIVPAAKDDRRPAQERVEAAERADAMAVALAQPHRDGIDDRMLVEPLGVFCRRQWPPRMSDHGEDLNIGHRSAMYRAGQMYAEAVHQHRVLMGLGSGGRTRPEGDGVELSDAALREKCTAARVRRENADAALRGVFSGAISAMIRVAVDELPPTAYQEDLVRHCLWVLAVHFVLVKPGVRY